MVGPIRPTRTAGLLNRRKKHRGRHNGPLFQSSADLAGGPGQERLQPIPDLVQGLDPGVQMAMQFGPTAPLGPGGNRLDRPVHLVHHVPQARQSPVELIVIVIRTYFNSVNRSRHRIRAGDILLISAPTLSLLPGVSRPNLQQPQSTGIERNDHLSFHHFEPSAR